MKEKRHPELAAMVQEKLPRVRFQMWNGQWAKAIRRMHSIFISAGQISNQIAAARTERIQRFRTHLLDLRNYLVSNQNGLTKLTMLMRAATALGFQARRP